MSGPELRDVTLGSCCRRALQDMHDVQQLARVLQAALSASPWITIIGSNPVAAIVSLTMMDWDALDKALHAVPNIARNRCMTAIHKELSSHTGNDARTRFWSAMERTFR